MNYLKIITGVALMTLGLGTMSCDDQTSSADQTNEDKMEINSETPPENINQSPKPVQVSNKKEVYEHTEVDVKPMFSDKCLNQEDPWACTVSEVTQFVQQNIEWPEKALGQNQEGVEEVTFVVLQDGSLARVKHVVSKDRPCDGCQQAAVDVVGKMDEWIPGEKDGEKVAVRLTLPIRFRPL